MAIALLALLAAAAAPPPRPALTPERYKAAVAPITDCRAFTRRFAGLPYAAPLLRSLFADGIPQQTPNETGEEFVGRIVDRLFTRLGDPSRVYAAMPLAQAAHYDAARGVLVIAFPVPYEATLGPTPSEEGGELRGLYDFPPGVLPETLELKMSPADSWRFRTGGGRLQVIALMQDYGTEPTKAAGPAGGAAGEGRRLVRLTPKCALVSNNGVAVPGWSYDAWNTVSAE